MATASTAGSTAPRPPEASAGPARLVARFGGTERTLHWAYTAGFLGMLVTGLVLYVPPLSGLASRETVKAIHLGVALAWMTALALVAVTGDRQALRRSREEIEQFTPDDLRWLRGKKTPQGRFNAGQKAHTVVQAAFAVLFVISGSLLWLGERVNVFRLPGSVALHDGTMFLAVFLLLGHLWLALIWPATRPAMRGILRGTVRADWAARHHAGWDAPAAGPRTRRAPGPRRLLAGAAVTLAGGLAIVLVTTSGSGAPPTPAAASTTPAAGGPAPPLKPGADVLSLEAQQAVQAGDLPTATSLLRQGTRQDPKRADLRRSLGLVLAQSGDLPGAQRELVQAVALAPGDPDGHFLLGAVQVNGGERAAGRRELQEYLKASPRGRNAALARRLLRR